MCPHGSLRKAGIRPALALLCLIAGASLPGCDYLPFGYTNIGDIVAKAPQFEASEVKIRGAVTNANKIPLINIKSYNVKDDTGEVTVITSDSLPAEGQKIAIRAVAQNALVVGGRSFGLTLKETARLPTF
jgi:hypothetical protein